MKNKSITWLLILLLVPAIFVGCASGSKSNGNNTITTTNAPKPQATGTDHGTTTTVATNPESKPPVAQQPLVLKGPGFSPSNLLNEGMAAEHDGYIYHIDQMFQGNLWKTSVNSGESELLLEGSLHDINANGGAVFAAGSVPPSKDGGKLDLYGIFRIQADGTGFTVVKEGSFDNLMLQDDYLYFTDVKEGGLYRMKYDGTDEKRLLEKIQEEVVIINEAIYFVTDLQGSNDRHLYTMPLDGSTPPKLLVKDLWGGFYAAGNSLYFELRGNSTDKTYRYDTVSKTDEFYMDKAVNNLNTDRENLYYFWDGKRQDNEDQGFYQKNLASGKETMVMKAKEMYDINLAGGKIFWHSNDDQRRIMVMNLDGTNQAFAEQKAD